MENNDEKIKHEDIDFLKQFDLDNLKESKALSKFYKFAFVLAPSNFIGVILALLGLPYFAIIPISLLCGLGTYFGLKKLEQKEEYNNLVENHYLIQTMNIFKEVKLKDPKIRKTTALFYKNIEEKEGLKNLDVDTTSAINQYLYLINSNYYELITNQVKLTRKELIDKILNILEIYASKKEAFIFSMDDVKAVTNSCFFISDNLKDKIVKEFKNSEVICDNTRHYRIVSKEISLSSLEDIINYNFQDYSSIEEKLMQFDVNSIEWYEFLLEQINVASNNQYRSVYSFSWDLYAIKDIMSFMLNNYEKELTEFKGEYFKADVVMHLLYNVLAYATVNNCGKIGINEIINTFKKWDFFEDGFELKMKILDGIFAEFNIDYSLHPYRKKRPQDRNNIINFKKS